MTGYEIVVIGNVVTIKSVRNGQNGTICPVYEMTGELKPQKGQQSSDIVKFE